MIYKGTRVCKIRDYDIDEDSPHYIKDSKLPQAIVPCRLMLKEVIYWERYLGEADDNGSYFKGYKNSDLVYVDFQCMSPVILIVSLEVFDLVMENYNNNTMIFRPQ